MAKDNESQQSIHSWLKLLPSIKKSSFIYR